MRTDTRYEENRKSKGDMEGGRKDGRGTHLVVTIQLEIVLGLQRIGVGMFGRGFDAFGDIREDLFDAEHAVCVET